MTAITSASAVLGALLIAILQATSAQALNNRSWVSRTGSDANPCSVAQPCATFQHAHDATVPGGEISVLTPGDYSFVNITKSIGITNDGSGEAGILATSGIAAVFVNAGAGDVVSLRGLVLEGAVSGDFGIFFTTGSALHVQNCVIRNFQGTQGFGILFGNHGHSKLFVSDTIIFNNGTNGPTGGILVIPQTAADSADVTLDRVHSENNVVGLRVDAGVGSARVIVRQSVFSGNLGPGIYALNVNFTDPGALIVVDKSTAANNGAAGIRAEGTHANVLLSGSTITRNGTGVEAIDGGQLISYGNNRNNNNIGAEGTATAFFSLF